MASDSASKGANAPKGKESGQSAPSTPQLKGVTPPQQQQFTDERGQLNIQEISEFLTTNFRIILQSANDQSRSEEDRPQVYKNTEKAWTNRNSTTSVWSSGGQTLASGEPFLQALAKKIPVSQTQ